MMAILTESIINKINRCASRILRNLKNPSDKQDIIQDAFLLYCSQDKYNRPAQYKPANAVLSAYYNYRRKQKMTTTPITYEDTGEEIYPSLRGNPYESFSTFEQVDLIYDAIKNCKTITAKKREQLLNQMDLIQDGYSGPEIAEHLDIKLQTVHNNLRQIKNILKNMEI